MPPFVNDLNPVDQVLQTFLDPKKEIKTENEI